MTFGDGLYSLRSTIYHHCPKRFGSPNYSCSHGGPGRSRCALSYRTRSTIAKGHCAVVTPLCGLTAPTAPLMRRQRLVVFFSLLD